MRTLILATVMSAVASLAMAETNGAPLTVRLFYLRGAKETKSGEKLSEFKRVPQETTQGLLKEFDVYAVRRCNDLYHPTGDFASLLISEGELPLFFDNMSEAATFLSGRIKNVKDDSQAEAILSLLPALFGYSIVAKQPLMPGEKETERREVRDPKEWTRQFRKTGTGWELQCTLLFDPSIAYCNRITLSVDESGSITVSELKKVSSGAHYL